MVLLQLPSLSKFKNYIRNPEEISQWKEIGRISLPSFLELMLGGLFGMIDLVMLGRVSNVYIAAAGLTNQPMMLLIAVFAAINVGTTTLVAWSIGAKDYKEANKISGQVIFLNLIIGVILMIIGIAISGTAVTFMGATEETFSLAKDYFIIIMSGMPFIAITMAVTAALRGAGETKIPMMYNLITNFLNVIGNYILIYGKFGAPAMGVQGAALSTVISRVIACGAALAVVFFYKDSTIHIKIKECLKFNFNIIFKVVRIGIPAAVEQLIMQSGFMLYTRTVSALGTDVYSAHVIAMNICSLTFSPSMAFGIAATALTGINLGAKKPELAEKYVRKVRGIANAVSCVVGGVFLLFSTQLALIYTTDLSVARMSGAALRIVALAQPGQSTQMTLAGSLRGAGDTMYPLYASLAGVWIFRVGFAYVFVNIFHWGLTGAWLTLLLDQYMRTLVVGLRFKSGKWKTARVQPDKAEASEA